MSWLFGIIYKSKTEYNNFSVSENFDNVEIKNFFLALGKGPNSFFIKHQNDHIEAFLGVPIINSENSKIIVNKESVKKTLHHYKYNPDSFFGHFIHLNYFDNQLEIRNDIFGLRELYYLETDKGFIFSTRIDLLNLEQKETTFNPKEFSSLWLTHFQLSNKSIFGKIKKLGPGGKILYDGKSLKVFNKIFEKTNISNAKSQFPEIINKYCFNNEENDHNISLALSGGIDCRLILTQLLTGKKKFRCHTYINEENKDLKLSKIICKEFDIEQKLIERETFDISKYEETILNYYKQILPVIPLTQLLDFGIFGVKYLSNHLILDGGFGEFYRRQFFSRLYLKGYKIFNRDHFSVVKNSFMAPKPDIFNKEFKMEMDKYSDEFILDLISHFNEPKSNSDLSDILDLITLYFKLSNVYGAGQTVLDNYTTAIMPLAQKDSVNIALNISPSQKLDSKFVKSLIKRNNPKLSGINLVKDNLENPYWLNNKLVMLRLYVYRKYFKKENMSRYSVFYNSKDFIMDTLQSDIIFNNKFLNNNNNLKIAEEFFKGKIIHGNFIDWLLTFVLWSKANHI